MINPLDFYKTYTMYDGMRFVMISLFIVGLVMLHAYYYTRSRRLQIVNVMSWLSLEVIYILSAVIFTQIFKLSLDVAVQGVYFGIIFTQALNLLILTDFLVEEMKQKQFDIDKVTRKHFTFTLNISTLIILAVLAGVVFITGDFTWGLVLFGINAVLTLGATHLIVRSQLKEPFPRPNK